jgi:reverse gyrase
MINLGCHLKITIRTFLIHPSKAKIKRVDFAIITRHALTNALEGAALGD